MSAAPLRIVVAAEEAAGAQVLRLLAGSPHRVVGVLTAGLGDPAARLGYVARAPTLVKDPAFAATLSAEGVDLLLNIHSLCIAHRAVVAAPRLGSFNLHPGPLPGYAGLNAPSWAIYHGERTHAVTLHWMDAGLDTGDIVATAPVPITPDDTGYTLSARCVRVGMPLVAALLAAAAREPPAIARAPQPAGVRRCFGREAPNGGWVAWHEPAQRIVDLVRAADYSPFPSPWGHARARLPGDGEWRDVELVKVMRTGLETGGVPPGTVGDRVGGDVVVAAADEWVRVRRLRLDGRDVAPAAVLPVGACLGAAEATP